MVKTMEGKLISRGKKFGIIVSRFNDFITRRLLDGCLDTLKRHGAEENDIEVVWVPGSFEVPQAADKLAKSGKYNCLICLGTLIRGATPHFDYIANEMTKGIAQIPLRTGVPTAFGVITAESIEQAVERAGTKKGNKGADAAMSAIEMTNLFDEI